MENLPEFINDFQFSYMIAELQSTPKEKTNVSESTKKELSKKVITQKNWN